MTASSSSHSTSSSTACTGSSSPLRRDPLPGDRSCGQCRLVLASGPAPLTHRDPHRSMLNAHRPASIWTAVPTGWLASNALPNDCSVWRLSPVWGAGWSRVGLTGWVWAGGLGAWWGRWRLLAGRLSCRAWWGLWAVSTTWVMGTRSGPRNGGGHSAWSCDSHPDGSPGIRFAPTSCREGRPMRVMLLASAFNSLTQRVHTELREAGHIVSVEVAHGDDDALRTAIGRFRPDVILAPMLTKVVPEDVWSQHPVLIVHPGPMGDRGPSSLDWAILEGQPRWGVTVLSAVEEMDAGPIWASVPFDVAPVGKSDLYRSEVSDAASRAVHLALERFASGTYQPVPLDYFRPDVTGTRRPLMTQADRRIDWAADDTATVLRKLRSGDSQPGVLDAVFGAEYFLHGACAEDELRGEPGAVIATRAGAICRATLDGAVWILQLRPRKVPGGPATHKRPAALVIGDLLADVPEVPVRPADAAGRDTWADIRYREDGAVGWLEWRFPAGAMSSEQCERLLAAYRQAAARPTSVLLLGPRRDFFSNGIHLNVIEGAEDPAFESWRNIVAIDDVVEAILTTTDKYTVALLPGNAAAGGVMMALAADEVWCRDAAVLNPHYRLMGLPGSEFWTYTLPRRVGTDEAQEIISSTLPVNARQALALGLADRVLPGGPAEFEAQCLAAAAALAASPDLKAMLLAKSRRRVEEERTKPLVAYRAAELEQMHRTFFNPAEPHHALRTGFVRGGPSVEPSNARQLAVLRETRLLVPLPVHVLDRMADLVEPMPVSAGTVIVRQGEPGDCVYFIASGSYRVEADGRHVNTLSAGDTLGEIAVLGSGVRTSTVVATTDGELLQLSGDSFRAALAGDPLVREDAEELARSRRETE